MIEMACISGRKTKPKLKIGICGGTRRRPGHHRILRVYRDKLLFLLYAEDSGRQAGGRPGGDKFGKENRKGQVTDTCFLSGERLQAI